MNQKPVAVGLLLCEQVIVEEKTRNVTPVNCFSRLMVERVPSEPVAFVLFATLTDGLGEMSLGVTIERLDTLNRIYQRFLTMRFTDPLQEVRYILRVRNSSFPRFGAYQVCLLMDNELLALKKFHVLARENKP